MQKNVVIYYPDKKHSKLICEVLASIKEVNICCLPKKDTDAILACNKYEVDIIIMSFEHEREENYLTSFIIQKLFHPQTRILFVFAQSIDGSAFKVQELSNLNPIEIEAFNKEKFLEVIGKTKKEKSKINIE